MKDDRAKGTEARTSRGGNRPGTRWSKAFGENTRRLWAEDAEWRERVCEAAREAQTRRWTKFRLDRVREFVDLWVAKARHKRGMTREQAIAEIRELLGQVEADAAGR